MIYTLRFLSRLLFFLGRVSRFIPAGLAGLFVIFNFLVIVFTKGFSPGITYLATTFFASEYIINTNVKLAIINSPAYTFNAFLQIVSSLFVLLWVIKFIGFLFVKISGSQAEWGAYLMAVFFVFAIELSVVKIVDGHWGFIPIYDGIIFLLRHLQPILTNIHWF